MKQLIWMKNSTLTDLHTNLLANLNRYRSGRFDDLIDAGWRQKEVLEYDESALARLGGDSRDDLEDSLIVFEVFKDLPPRLAVCMNLWAPLIHTELLEYTRKRWLQPGKSDEEHVKSIETHVFKSGIGGYRDDNAVARLWWSGYIGSRIAGSLNIADIRAVLKPLMRTTDTRQSVFERPGIFSETSFAKHIADYVAEKRLPGSDRDQPFRDFMVSINLRSNGRHFGDMTKQEVFSFLQSCH